MSIPIKVTKINPIAPLQEQLSIQTIIPITAASTNNSTVIPVPLNLEKFAQLLLSVNKETPLIIKEFAEILVRYDNNPKLYEKQDYRLLLIFIASIFGYFYNRPDFRIVTEWEQQLADDKVPSEKLVKSTIDILANAKQDKLISGLNIKTLNNESLLGSGDLYANPYKFLFLTEDLYDALVTKDLGTLYFLWESDEEEETTWYFGNKFPLRFGGTVPSWYFGSKFPLVFGVASTSLWKFGEKFPLRFGNTSLTTWMFGNKLPLQFGVKNN